MGRKKLYLKAIDPHHVSVIFRFDWDVINALRTIQSRRYIADTKENIIAKKDINTLKDMLPLYDCIEKGMSKTAHKITITADGFRVTPKIEPFNAKTSRLLFLRRPRDGYELSRILKDEGYEIEVEDNLEYLNVHLPQSPDLYPYQEDCMEFLRQNDYTGLVSLDMGLGKTIVACNSIRELKKSPVLIVAPSSLLIQWKNELEHHYGFKNAKIITSKIKNGDREKAFNDGDIIITNYELLRTVDVTRHFELLILDECQRVKNWKTKVAQSIAKIVAKRVMGLSGTPVENQIMELYNVTDQIQPAFFGTQRKFYDKYVRQGGRYHNLEEVYRLLQSLMFRVNKDEVIDQLPELRKQLITVQLSQKEMNFYEKMVATAMETKGVLGAIANAKVFASSAGLRMDIAESSKEKELFTTLNEIEEKTLVFTQYKQEVYRLKTLTSTKLQDREIFTMTGDTNRNNRDVIIEQFKDSENGILFMTEIGTHGLNLQAANVCINVDLPWNYSRLDQRVGRIHRLGSEHDKNLLINMVSDDTIDLHIMDLIEHKKELFDLSIDGAKKYIAKAFMNDLKERGIIEEEIITKESVVNVS